MLILYMWLQFINKVKFMHQGEGHIKGKVKYLHPFRFYVAHTLCKRVVYNRLKCVLVSLLKQQNYPKKLQAQLKRQIGPVPQWK